MSYAFEVFVAIIAASAGYWFFLRKRYRTAADDFKKSLLDGVSAYESDQTTLSAIVLNLYPEHDRAFKQFLLFNSKSRQSELMARWQDYTDVYTFFRQFGIFGIAITETPHPDFPITPESLDAVSRKRKGQVLRVLRRFIEDL